MMASRTILDLIDDDGDPRRVARRRKMILSARLETAQRGYDIVVRDVSLAGARLTGVDLPPQGSRAMLRRGSFRVNGTLVWANGQVGGFQWDFPFHDEEELAEALKGLQGQPAPAEASFRRPAVASKGHTPRYSDGTGWLDETRRRR